jgi:hypothetical protein
LATHFSCRLFILSSKVFREGVKSRTETLSSATKTRLRLPQVVDVGVELVLDLPARWAEIPPEFIRFLLWVEKHGVAPILNRYHYKFQKSDHILFVDLSPDHYTILTDSNYDDLNAHWAFADGQKKNIENRNDAS